ncbi:hypothetical protein QBC38DRAFT_518505, partial [Podospora fimiseda]
HNLTSIIKSPPYLLTIFPSILSSHHLHPASTPILANQASTAFGFNLNFNLAFNFVFERIYPSNSYDMADPVVKMEIEATQGSIESNGWSIATSAASSRPPMSRERSNTPSPSGHAQDSYKTSNWGAVAEPAPVTQAPSTHRNTIVVQLPDVFIKIESSPETEVDEVDEVDEVEEVHAPRIYPRTHPLNPEHPFYKKATDSNRTHRQWTRLEGYVIKCDVCEERALGVLHQCTSKSCHERICVTCAKAWAYIQHDKLDSQHYIDPDEHDWEPLQKKKPVPKPRSRKRAKKGGPNAGTETPDPVPVVEPLPEVRKRQLIEDDDFEEISPPKKQARMVPEADMGDYLSGSPNAGAQDSEEARRRRISAAMAAAPDNVDLVTDDEFDDQNKSQANQSKQSDESCGHLRAPEQDHGSSYAQNQRPVHHGYGEELHPAYIEHQHRGDQYHGRGESSNWNYDRNPRLDENILVTRQRIVMHFFRQIFAVNLRSMPRSFQRLITSIPETWNAPPSNSQRRDFYERPDYQEERGAPLPPYRSMAEYSPDDVDRRVTAAWVANADLQDERHGWGDLNALQLLWEVFEVRRDTMAGVVMDQTVHWFINERNRIRSYQDDMTWRKLQRSYPAPPPAPRPPRLQTPPHLHRHQMRGATPALPSRSTREETPAPPSRRSVSLAPGPSPLAEVAGGASSTAGSDVEADQSE